MIRTLTAMGLAACCALGAAPAFASATDDVRAAIQRFAALQSFEMVSQSDGKTYTIDVINRPAAMHAMSPGMEMISLGSSSYVKMGPSWRKLPSSSRTMPMRDPVRHFADRVNDFTATDLGMKPVGGELLHAYRVSDKSGGDDSGIVYIGSDRLPHRFEGSDHGVVKLTKFNGVAPIRAPI
jgi:hypothetical protein